MFVLMMLMMFLDVQRPAIAVDGMEKKFVVTELTETALTGCATNPQGDGFNDDPLTVNWLKSPEPTDSSVTSTWLSDGVSDTKFEPMKTMAMRVVPADPPNPDPNPPTPPVASTPEPSTFAILGMTAATLLFLLFGRRCGRRLSRRI